MYKLHHDNRCPNAFCSCSLHITVLHRDQQDRQAICGRKMYPPSSLCLLSTFVTLFALPQCGRLFPSPFPILKNCLPVSYFLVSPASFYLSHKSFCFLQVLHLSSSFSRHFLPSDQNPSPNPKAILASVISRKLSHSL